MASTKDAEYALYYWPGIKGRGEYIRLMFEDAGVPYYDVGRHEGFDAIRKYFFEEGATPFPVRAAPAVKKGEFIVCNTPAIMYYLGEQFGWLPASSEDRALVNSILCIVADGVSEGRLAFHPKDFYASHKTQVAESGPYIVQYGEKRLPLYLKFFESLLARNPSGFLVGGDRTAADIAVYHYLCAAKQHYGEWYEKIDAPGCKAFRERIGARPNIAAYLASERCYDWDKDSMM